MQTFLPYSSFTKSAECLDNKRLGKQRVEAYQIFRILLGDPYQCNIDHYHRIKIHAENFNPELRIQLGIISCLDCDAIAGFRKTPWYNHPAVQMWKGYEWALVQYIAAMCSEWFVRGYNDSILKKLEFQLDDDLLVKLNARKEYPSWLGNEQLHASHRSNLMRKDSRHYRQFGWIENGSMPYWWPTKV